MRNKKPLCQSYDPFTEQAVIYNQIFLPGRVQVALRPFHIAQDLALINNWFYYQFPQLPETLHHPFQYTEDYYTTLLTGANSQPLLGLIDRQPAFQVDVYHASLGPESLVDVAQFSGTDFIMQLLLSPDAAQSLPAIMHSLLACLDCFFSYVEIDRVIWMTNAREKNFRFIAGLAELDEIQCGDDLQCFFIISKEKFRQVQYSLPLYPQKQSITMGC